MKLSFRITKNRGGEWTLTLNRDDTGEQLYTLRGLRSEAEARHAAESMRAAVHTAAVLCVEDSAARASPEAESRGASAPLVPFHGRVQAGRAAGHRD